MAVVVDVCLNSEVFMMTKRCNPDLPRNDFLIEPKTNKYITVSTEKKQYIPTKTELNKFLKENGFTVLKKSLNLWFNKTTLQTIKVSELTATKRYLVQYLKGRIS